MCLINKSTDDNTQHDRRAAEHEHLYPFFDDGNMRKAGREHPQKKQGDERNDNRDNKSARAFKEKIRGERNEAGDKVGDEHGDTSEV